MQIKKHRLKIIIVIMLIIIILLLISFFISDKKNPSSKNAIILPSVVNNIDKIIPSWENLLVNKDVLLPEDFDIDLIDINNVAVLKRERINKKITDQFTKLVDAASKDGIKLLVISAYRSVSDQTNVYNNAVKSYQSRGYSKEEAIKKTEETINKPRSSEHHTGLAIDIVGINAWNQIGSLDERLANTKEFKWLENNAYKYGFILRYPKDKVEITKVNYEPWHFRYVGDNLAYYLTKNHLTLEEYYDSKK